ncbi:hypothetical protein F4778DRAFT_739827, partial [Xylariomycetidae sp. FL2044]
MMRNYPSRLTRSPRRLAARSALLCSALPRRTSSVDQLNVPKLDMHVRTRELRIVAVEKGSPQAGFICRYPFHTIAPYRVLHMTYCSPPNLLGEVCINSCSFSSARHRISDLSANAPARLGRWYICCQMCNTEACPSVRPSRPDRLVGLQHPRPPSN